MSSTGKITLVVAFGVVVLLFLLFTGGIATGAMMSGGMMGSGMMMGGMSWMWVPTLLTLGLGVLIGWAIWAKK